MLINLTFLNYADSELLKAVLNRFVSSGITDIRDVQKQLDEYTNEKIKEAYSEKIRVKNKDKDSYFTYRANVTKNRARREKETRGTPTCPECGVNMVAEVKFVDGVHEFVLSCKYGCRYSEYVGTEQDFKKKLGII